VWTKQGGGGEGLRLNVAIAILGDWGYTGTFYTPDAATFDNYYLESYGGYYGEEILTIVWKGSSITDFNAYKAKWNTSSNNIESGDYYLFFDLTSKISVYVIFVTNGGTENGYTIESNSILFTACYENRYW